MNNKTQEELENTFKGLKIDSDELKEFQQTMSNMFASGLNEMPTFSEELHKRIKEEFEKLHQAEKEYHLKKEQENNLQ